MIAEFQLHIFPRLICMSGNPESRQRRGFEWLIIALIILFRFYFAGHDEIAALQNDSTNYARHAVYAYQSDGFSMIPPQSPGISMLAMVTSEFGIPYKLFLDMALIIAAILAWRLTHQLTRSSLCAMSVFVVVALSPWFLRSSTAFMSEAPTAILLLGIVLSGIHLVKSPAHPGTLAVASLLSTFYLLTRSEFPLLLVFWIVIGILIFLVGERNPERASRKTQLVRSSRVIVPLLIALGGMQIVKQVHLRCYGVAAITAAESSGMKDLMNALYSIPPENEIRFAPVTLRSLEKACDECPTLNEHRKRLLDPTSPAFTSARKNLELENEVGTWLNWHLVWAFRGINAASNEKMHQAAKEIRDAQMEKRLGVRLARFPVDPLWRQWLSDVPMSSFSMLRVSTMPRLLNNIGTTRFTHRRVDDEVVEGFFDESLLRRNGIGYESTLRVSGSCPNSGYRRAKIFSASRSLLGEVIIESTPQGSQFGFSIQDFNIKQHHPIRVVLYRHVEEGATNSSVRITRKEGTQQFVAKPSEQIQEDWTVNISTSKPSLLRKQIRSTVIQKSPPFIMSLFALCFLVGAVRGMEPGAFRMVIVSLLIGLLFLLLRCLFYALVDVWLGWSANRYVEPNSLFAHFTLVLVSFSLGAIANRAIPFLRANRFSRRRPAQDEQLTTETTHI